MKSIEVLQKIIKQELKEAFSGVYQAANPFVPHREPAAEAPQNDEPEEIDRIYTLAYEARIATEDLIRELEDPFYNEVFEEAFKATQKLRNVLNALEEMGADPPNDERVVTPPAYRQKYAYKTGGSKFLPQTFSGGIEDE